MMATEEVMASILPDAPPGAWLRAQRINTA
jgi:hypothetical protein